MATRTPLFQHCPHPYEPQNVNVAHQAERMSLNDRLAVFISTHVGSMTCGYLFAFIGAASLIGAISGNTLLALAFGALSSYFLQLVLLPIIMVGQNVQARHSELLAESEYQISLKNDHDLEQIMRHLSAQDEVLLELRRAVRVGQT